jgi:hypothetical protein
MELRCGAHLPVPVVTELLTFMATIASAERTSIDASEADSLRPIQTGLPR